MDPVPRLSSSSVVRVHGMHHRLDVVLVCTLDGCAKWSASSDVHDIGLLGIVHFVVSDLDFV